MARPIPTRSYQEVLDIVLQFSDAVRIEQIEEKLASPPARRTLQRWLNELIKQGRLRKRGQGRATRYWCRRVIETFVDVPKAVYINAVLGVCELTRIELIREVFVWAYKRSCSRYSALRQSLGQPDLFRLRYRQHIADAVANVVRGRMNKQEAVSHVRRYAEKQVVESDRERFIEVVETQLISLHEGNIARYQLRSAEFRSWQAVWE